MTERKPEKPSVIKNLAHPNLRVPIILAVIALAVGLGGFYWMLSGGSDSGGGEVALRDIRDDRVRYEPGGEPPQAYREAVEAENERRFRDAAQQEYGVSLPYTFGGIDEVSGDDLEYCDCIIRDDQLLAQLERLGYYPGVGGPDGTSMTRLGEGDVYLDEDGRLLGADGEPLMIDGEEVFVGPDGQLFDADGNPILGPDGQPLFLGEDGQIVDEDGRLVSGVDMVDSDGVVYGPDGRIVTDSLRQVGPSDIWLTPQGQLVTQDGRRIWHQESNVFMSDSRQIITRDEEGITWSGTDVYLSEEGHLTNADFVRHQRDGILFTEDGIMINNFGFLVDAISDVSQMGSTDLYISPDGDITDSEGFPVRHFGAPVVADEDWNLLANREAVLSRDREPMTITRRGQQQADGEDIRHAAALLDMDSVAFDRDSMHLSDESLLTRVGQSAIYVTVDGMVGDRRGAPMDFRGEPVFQDRSNPTSEGWWPLVTYFRDPVVDSSGSQVFLTRDGELVDEDGEIVEDGVLTTADGVAVTGDGQPIVPDDMRAAFTEDGEAVFGPDGERVFVGEDGQLLDEDGRPILGPDGQALYMDEDGNIVDEFGNIVDGHGLTGDGVADDGFLTVDGDPLMVDGQRVRTAEDGSLLGPDGQPLVGPDGQPLFMDEHGRIVDADGNVIDPDDLDPETRAALGLDDGYSVGPGGVLLGEDGQPLLGVDGRPLFVDEDGNIIDADGNIIDPSDLPPESLDALMDDGYTIGPDGMLLGPDGQPMLGPDGQPLYMDADGNIVDADGNIIDPDDLPEDVRRAMEGGDFTVGPDGMLLGEDGQPILGPDGQPLFLDEDGNIVDADGNIIPGSPTIDDLSPEELRRLQAGADSDRMQRIPGTDAFMTDDGLLVDDQGRPLSADGQRMRVDSDGTLLDADGQPVLGPDGRPLQVGPDRTLLDADGRPIDLSNIEDWDGVAIGDDLLRDIGRLASVGECVIYETPDGRLVEGDGRVLVDQEGSRLVRDDDDSLRRSDGSPVYDSSGRRVYLDDECNLVNRDGTPVDESLIQTLDGEAITSDGQYSTDDLTAIPGSDYYMTEDGLIVDSDGRPVLGPDGQFMYSDDGQRLLDGSRRPIRLGGREVSLDGEDLVDASTGDPITDDDGQRIGVDSDRSEADTGGRQGPRSLLEREEFETVGPTEGFDDIDAPRRREEGPRIGFTPVLPERGRPSEDAPAEPGTQQPGAPGVDPGVDMEAIQERYDQLKERLAEVLGEARDNALAHQNASAVRVSIGGEPMSGRPEPEEDDADAEEVPEAEQGPGEVIARNREIIYGVLMQQLNTDVGTAILIELTGQGLLSGARTTGNFTFDPDSGQVEVTFEDVTLANGVTVPMTGYGLTTDTFSQALNVNIDQNLVRRYAAYSAASLIQGAGVAVEEMGTRVEAVEDDGSSSTTLEGIGLTGMIIRTVGELGSSLAPQFERYVDLPPTATMPRGERIGIILTDDLVY